MPDLLFPKNRKKKKRQHHGKTIMPCRGCYLCRLLDDDDRPKTTEVHHIYFGPNRNKSEQYGFTVNLCAQHHREGPDAVHKNSDVCRILQRACQAEYEKTHSRDDFLRIIGKNYL